MTKLKLKAAKRKLLGRKVKRLRKEGILPANVFGKSVESTAVQLDLSDFKKTLSKAGETTIIYLAVEKKEKPVLVSNVQYDPVTDDPIHADFLQVNLKEKVTAQVPVEFTGESPAEKQGLGTVVKYIDEVEVEALPTDLPESLVLDISKLQEVDQTFTVADLKVDKKVEIQNEKDQIIAKVEPPREEEEEETVSETEEGEVPEGEEQAEETGGEEQEKATAEEKEQEGKENKKE